VTTSTKAATATTGKKPAAKRAKGDGGLSELEERVKALQEENLELKLQLRVGREPNVSKEEEDKQKLIRELSDLVNRKAPDAELQVLLRSFVARFSDVGEDREKLVEKHMDQLERMLTPSQVTKMCMWTLQQDEFFDSSAAPGPAPVVEDDTDSLWTTILKIIAATPEQVEKFKTYRQDAQALTRGLRFMSRECADVRQRIAMKNKALGEEMRALQDLLTPTQFAKYLIFVQDNPASISLLARVWKIMQDA